MDYHLNGICSVNSAFSKNKVTKRLYLEYQPPPTSDELLTDNTGLKDFWISRNEDIISDLKWFLKLDYSSFWSHVIYDQNAMNIVSSFLQEAYPRYLINEFPHNKDIWKSYQTLEYLVFLFINRLVIIEEFNENCLSKDNYAKIIYENYIFSIPLLFDICVHYGEKYNNEVSNIINTIFAVQPLYIHDLNEAIKFSVTTLKNIEHDLEVKPVVTNGEANKLSEHLTKGKVTPKVFKDIILHSLDTLYSIKMFLTFYKPACKIFHQNLFETNLVAFYENAIPEMFKKLELFFNKIESQSQYKSIRSQINFLRFEILNSFNYIIDSCINILIEESENLSEEQVKNSADEYLAIISEAISEKLFIHDYHNIFPMDVHLDSLHYLNPELDRMKYDFIIESIQTAFDIPKIPDKNNFINEYVKKEISNKVISNSNKKISGVELDSLITQVKDILSHLGDGFIAKCLQHFDYSSETVINTILEDRLPEHLKNIDLQMPMVVLLEEQHPLPDRLNIYDNDEFDFMTQDYINPEKIILGKKETKHKDLKDMLDDKSFRSEFREMYHDLGIIQDEENVYDDEYDDTYDAANVCVEEAGESERRPFVTPRILHGSALKEEIQESDEEEEQTPSRSTLNDFVQNPEEIRTRQENARMQKYQHSHPNRTRAVVGNPKGQGQSKDVIVNRNKKTVNKSSGANHNRKYGAQRKRNQGLLS